jgi:hypothetical protein
LWSCCCVQPTHTDVGQSGLSRCVRSSCGSDRKPHGACRMLYIACFHDRPGAPPMSRCAHALPALRLQCTLFTLPHCTAQLSAAARHKAALGAHQARGRRDRSQLPRNPTAVHTKLQRGTCSVQHARTEALRYRACSRVLTGTHGCSRVLTGAHGCSRVLTGAHGCSRVLMGAQASPA